MGDYSFTARVDKSLPGQVSAFKTWQSNTEAQLVALAAAKGFTFDTRSRTVSVAYVAAETTVLDPIFGTILTPVLGTAAIAAYAMVTMTWTING